VTNPGGTSSTSSADQFNYVPAPTVSAISPTTGPAAGGTSVTITGTNFTGASAVKFGATAATSFTVTDDSHISATAPAGTGTVDVTVTTVGGTSSTSAADQYTYQSGLPPTVTAVKPGAGPTAGGTKVTITGTNFVAPASVNFGSNPGTNVIVVSKTSITAIAPAGSAGSVDVTVTTPAGASAVNPKKDLYAYGPPHVTSFTPSSGITGSTVTITGSGFSGGDKVTFGTLASKSVTIVSGTSLKATVPNGDATPSTITVTSVQGSSTSVNQFTPTFAITSFSPTSGPAGTVVTINGIGFTSTSTVKFHGVAGTNIVHVSSTQLQATVPATATTGNITVTNTVAPKGTVTSPTAYTVG
jgi:hypothetical protein